VDRWLHFTPAMAYLSYNRTFVVVNKDAVPIMFTLEQEEAETLLTLIDKVHLKNKLKAESIELENTNVLEFPKKPPQRKWGASSNPDRKKLKIG